MHTNRLTKTFVTAALSLTLGMGLCGCSAQDVQNVLFAGLPQFGNTTAETTSDTTESTTDTSATDATTTSSTTVDPNNFDSLTWNETIAPDLWYDAGASDITAAQQTDLDTTGKTSAFATDTDGSKYVVTNGLRVTSETIEYGKRDRGDISNEDVRGWPHPNEKVSVTFASGKIYNGYFWNRSHLVAHMLGGEDEAANLVTGTRAQNVGDNGGSGGMQYCEYLAYNYVTEHEGVYVDYVATAAYRDGENIPRAVLVNMKSSDGGLDKQIVVYNAMPGYQIDYVTGEVLGE